MPGVGKKAAAVASAEFATLMDQVSKAALVDALWGACQLGTGDSPAAIAERAAFELQHALLARGDRVPPAVRQHAHRWEQRQEAR